ncbi:MAG: peptidoglycan DD-metalloendopeptidase family protein [Lysobacterales bacterium]
MSTRRVGALRSERAVIGAVSLTLLLLGFVVLPGWAAVTGPDVVAPLPEMVSEPLPLPKLSPIAASTRSRDSQLMAMSGNSGDSAPPDWKTVAVAPGQTLGGIFEDQGLPAPLLGRLLDATAADDTMTRIRPGQEFKFLLRASGELAALQFDADEATRVVLHVDGDQVHEERIKRDVERRVQVAAGRIESSLFGAADRAGVSDTVVLKMATALGYDIDFARDIQPGDQFEIVYEEVYCEGGKLRDGDVLAARFTNDGKEYFAVRFTGADGASEFYDADGRPLKKSFLRTPLEFTRISSGFTANRRHPILGRMRAHRGVDYAAPMGTPVRAAGNAVVQLRGVQSGYGNVIILKHDTMVTTLYGHLSRFASTLRNGQRVKQGDIIGYVGKTGLATGPHLHYEFRHGGSHRDPLTVTLPEPEPLRGAALAQFMATTRPLVAQLDLAGNAAAGSRLAQR